MASTNNEDSGDAPLIDLNDASVKKLIARAKRRGVITYDELNEALPQDQMSSEQIEDIMAAISEMGVNIVESDEDAVDQEDQASDDMDEPDPLGADRPAVEKKKETVERTDDPVRMYLREMGAVELLSREGEIAIAKRIEAGRDTMILGLCESPITFHAIIQWSEALNAGEMQLREILDLDAMLSKEPAPENLTEDGEEEGDGEISEATAGDESIEAMAGGAGTRIGTGGMITKVIAAKRAGRSGAHTAIASGRETNPIIRLANGEAVGTLLVSHTQPLAARKQWLADHLQLAGRLLLDAGAVDALKSGKSLLPIGVTAAEGEFERGAAVACISPDGREIARGLSNYGSGEARLIARKNTPEIESILGYVDEPEIIHRDNLILS